MENWEDQSLVFPAPLNRPTSVATWSLKFFSCGKFIIPLDQNSNGKATFSEQTEGGMMALLLGWEEQEPKEFLYLHFEKKEEKFMF